MSDNISKEFNPKNILRAITEVTSWQLLGLNLDVPRHKLEEFRQSYPHNLAQCKLQLISHWLDNDLDASWRKLACALDHEYHSLADSIRKKYVSRETRATERSRTPSPLATVHSRTNHFSFPHLPPVVVRQPSLQQSPRNNELEQKRPTSHTESGGKNILLCLFCGSFRTVGKASDIAKGPKRRYVELLQESPAPDKMLQYLLQGRLDAFYVGEEGRTLLHFAAIHCSVESLKTLIAFRGPDVSPASPQGTPLDLAGVNINGGGEIKRLLRSVGGREYSVLSRKEDTIKLPRSEGCRMLVLNCSGLSAILHIEALQRLEKGSGRKLAETFEWVVATGLSALFILLMMYGHQSLADVRQLYFKLRRDVFQRRPCSQALDTFLKSYLAPEMKMNAIQKPRILLPAMCKTATEGVQTHIFNNCLQDKFSEVPVWKVAHYLCCHPPQVPELDGYLARRDSAHLNLAGVGVRRAGEFYRERGQSEARIAKVVRLDQGQFGEPLLLDPTTCEEDVNGATCFVFNPVLPCPLFLSMSVDDRDVVDCVIETMKQLYRKADSLVKFLS